MRCRIQLSLLAFISALLPYAVATARDFVYGTPQGCLVALASPLAESEEIRWDGSCTNGWASGNGILSIYQSGRLASKKLVGMNRGRVDDTRNVSSSSSARQQSAQKGTYAAPGRVEEMSTAIIEKIDPDAKSFNDEPPNPAIPNKFYWWYESQQPLLRGVWRIIPPVSCAVPLVKEGWGKVVRNNCGFRIEVIACSQSTNCPDTVRAIHILDPFKIPRTERSGSMEGWSFPLTDRVISVAACKSNTVGFDWNLDTAYSIWDLEINSNSPTVTCLEPAKEPFDKTKVRKKVWPIYQKFSMGKLIKEVYILED